MLTDFLKFTRPKKQSQITSANQLECGTQSSSSILNAIIQASSDPVFVKDNQGKYLWLNKACADKISTVYTREECLGKTDFDLLAKEDATRLRQHDAEIMSNGTTEIVEEDVSSPTGIRNYLVTKGVYKSQTGEPLGIFGIAKDITEQKNQHRKIKEDKNLLQSLIDAIPLYISYLDPQHKFVFANKQYEKWLGIKREDLTGKHVSEIIGNKTYQQTLQYFQRPFAGETIEFESELESEDGKHSYRITHIPDIQNDIVQGIFVLVIDITTEKIFNETLNRRVIEKTKDLHEEIRRREISEEKVKNNLKEKEVLLNELNHRVKNNMQVIISMFSLQLRKINAASIPEIEGIFNELKSRIKAMLLVHEHLYVKDNLANINLSQYIAELTKQLTISYNVSSSKVRLNFESTPISINVNTAVPLGLITNELISNVYSHAFPENRTGNIIIKTTKINKSALELTIEDDGVGYSDINKLYLADTMGYTIINTLLKQINFEMVISSGDSGGLRIQLRGNY